MLLSKCGWAVWTKSYILVWVIFYHSYIFFTVCSQKKKYRPVTEVVPQKVLIVLVKDYDTKMKEIRTRPDSAQKAYFIIAQRSQKKVQKCRTFSGINPLQCHVLLLKSWDFYWYIFYIYFVDIVVYGSFLMICKCICCILLCLIWYIYMYMYMYMYRSIYIYIYYYHTHTHL